MRKAELLQQIELLQQLLYTQAADQRTLIAQLNSRVEEQQRRSQELEVRLEQRIAVLEQAYTAALSLLVEARERQREVVAHLNGALETQRQELQAIEAVLDAA